MIVAVAMLIWFGFWLFRQQVSGALRRQVAVGLLATGAVWLLLFVPVVLIYGGGLIWILGALEGLMLLLAGWLNLRAASAHGQRIR